VQPELSTPKRLVAERVEPEYLPALVDQIVCVPRGASENGVVILAALLAPMVVGVVVVTVVVPVLRDRGSDPADRHERDGDRDRDAYPAAYLHAEPPCVPPAIFARARVPSKAVRRDRIAYGDVMWHDKMAESVYSRLADGARPAGVVAIGRYGSGAPRRALATRGAYALARAAGIIGCDKSIAFTTA
jgi:hypothetical protein